ncbi:MAG TPA: hypothetical protein VL003_02285 [Pusillimonas sp.]|uniref:hypothetical protein n=1 Tax=Pusillimonas sp. TaxID=3040095 RepID=UPI002CF387CA|nr:hypothetical protein [Pusillimonas sp.]HUH86866.1 hypothetical protein [Pusillimonas sp.]
MATALAATIRTARITGHMTGVTNRTGRIAPRHDATTTNHAIGLNDSDATKRTSHVVPGSARIALTSIEIGPAGPGINTSDAGNHEVALGSDRCPPALKPSADGRGL